MTDNNSRPPRTNTEKQRDLKLEADMYLQGKSQQEISHALGLSPATVSRDLKKLQEEWRISGLHDMNLAKNMELARLDTLERTYWDAWERSKESAHSTTEAISGPGLTTTLSSEREQFGDPRYLNGVMSCIQKRCEILGLNAPKSIDLNNKGKPLWAQFIGASINILPQPPAQIAGGETIKDAISVDAIDVELPSSPP